MALCDLIRHIRLHRDIPRWPRNRSGRGYPGKGPRRCRCPTSSISPGGDEHGRPSPGPLPARRSGSKITCGALTHPGKVRENNEDHFLVARLAKSMQICQTQPGRRGRDPVLRRGRLPDGRRRRHGRRRGGRAGQRPGRRERRGFALNTLKWFLHLGRGRRERPARRTPARASRSPTARWSTRARPNARLYGMGTTLTMAYSVGADLYIVHAGDSRAYLFRDGEAGAGDQRPHARPDC